MIICAIEIWNIIIIIIFIIIIIIVIIIIIIIIFRASITMICLKWREHSLFNAVPNSIVLPQDFAHETVNFNLYCVVAIYSLCFSIMKSCSYWNSNSLATIVNISKRVHDSLLFMTFILF